MSLKALGINYSRLCNNMQTGLYSFRQVGLHTDPVHRSTEMSLLIPILGKGRVGHMVSMDLKDYRSIREFAFDGRRSQPLLFDDNLPHCFHTKGLCAAILGTVLKEK